MGRFEILFEAGIRGPQEAAEAYLDQVMEYLVDRGIEDPWIGLGPDKVEMTLTIEAESSEAALAEATQLVLGAIRASGAELPAPATGELGFELRKAELVRA